MVSKILSVDELVGRGILFPLLFRSLMKRKHTKAADGLLKSCVLQLHRHSRNFYSIYCNLFSRVDMKSRKQKLPKIIFCIKFQLYWQQNRKIQFLCVGIWLSLQNRKTILSQNYWLTIFLFIIFHRPTVILFSLSHIFDTPYARLVAIIYHFFYFICFVCLFLFFCCFFFLGGGVWNFSMIEWTKN